MKQEKMKLPDLGMGYVHARTPYICTEDASSLPSCPPTIASPACHPSSPHLALRPATTTSATPHAPSTPSPELSALASNPMSASVCGCQTLPASSCCTAGDSCRDERDIPSTVLPEMVGRGITWWGSNRQSEKTVAPWAWVSASPSPENYRHRWAYASCMRPPRSCKNQVNHLPEEVG